MSNSGNSGLKSHYGNIFNMPYGYKMAPRTCFHFSLLPSYIFSISGRGFEWTVKQLCVGTMHIKCSQHHWKTTLPQIITIIIINVCIVCKFNINKNMREYKLKSHTSMHSTEKFKQQNHIGWLASCFIFICPNVALQLN